MVKSCGWPHQIILNLFLVAAQFFRCHCRFMFFDSKIWLRDSKWGGRDHWRN